MAPDSVLEMISCNCSKSKCRTQACVCKAHGLSYTDLCGCPDDCKNSSENNYCEDISGEDPKDDVDDANDEDYEN